MKTMGQRLLFLVILAWITSAGAAQKAPDSTQLFKVVKQNGAAFVGKIISRDARELLLDTRDIGLVYIPKHEIREIIEIRQGEQVITGELFSTRYFLTTNGFSVKKGDNYIQWNLFGPDFQFGVADNLGLGIMTSWVGIPIVGSAKYTFGHGKKVCGGLGLLAGTGSWAFPEFGLLLPFGFVTYGNRINNVNASVGYGAVFQEITRTTYTLLDAPTAYTTNSYSATERTFHNAQGRTLFSLAGMLRINAKFSFVFDSFIMLPGNGENRQTLIETYDPSAQKITYSLKDEEESTDAFVVLSPGIRFQATENSSFQFGFTGIHVGGEFVPMPIPMIQWFRKI